MSKVIVTAALTGGWHGKEANPNLPEQPEEIAEQAIAAAEAGAAVVHIHARGKDGSNSADPRVYRDISDRIKAKSNVIVQLTTGGGKGVSVEERLGILELRPEMASLNTTIAVFFFKGQEHFFRNFRSDIEVFAKRMLDYGVKPELECYSLESIYEAENLISKGLIKKPYCFNLCLGINAQGAIKPTVKNLLAMIDALPADSVFTVSATGRHQLPMTIMGALLGGNSRVGLEDNIYYSKGVLARNNAELVARHVRILRELNLEIATPDEAREILGIGR